LGKFDKIIKEKLKNSIGGFLARILKIEYQQFKILEPKLQYTQEREADFVVEVIDNQGFKRVIHLEFQSENDTNMLRRMLLYRAFLFYHYRLAVRQYVIYMGPNELKMDNELQQNDLDYKYHLLDFKDYDYRLFLESDNPHEIVWAILGKIEPNEVSTATRAIIERLQTLQKGLALSQSVTQIRILAELRNFKQTIEEEINKMGVFLDIKKTSIYQDGKEEGKIEGKVETTLEVATKMLQEGIEINLVQKITGISLAELKKIQKNEK
jgi:predicted transposase/invertase (TIGR01784 family)